MVMQHAPAVPDRRPYKNVQSFTTPVQNLPATAVLDSVLQTLEKDLTRRGHLFTSSIQAYHPIWFLAETERNIFLWRNGMSIEEHRQFEFWVNVPQLVEKRIAQLEGFQCENPFLNPLWGNPYEASEQGTQEHAYLGRFLELTKVILPHAHALSRLGSALQRESSERSDLLVVLLPTGARGAQTDKACPEL